MSDPTIWQDEWESQGEQPWEGGTRSRRLGAGKNLGASLYEIPPHATVVIRVDPDKDQASDIASVAHAWLSTIERRQAAGGAAIAQRRRMVGTQ